MTKLTDESNYQSTPHLADVLRHQPYRRAHLARNGDGQFCIGVSIIVRLSGRHEVIIHIAALHPVQHVKQKHSTTDRLILEAPDAGVPSPLVRLLIRPFHHFLVCDLALAEPLRQRREGFGNVATHQLPHESQGERPLTVGDVGSLDAHEGESHLLAQFDGVVRVLDGLEAHQFPTGRRRLVDVTPVHASGDDFLIRLQEDGAISEIIEEGIDGRPNVEGIEPQGEDTRFTLSLGIKIFDFELFFFGNGIQAWVRVEQIRDKGQVELRIAGHEGRRSQKFATPKLVGMLKHLLGLLDEIPCLQRCLTADIGGELVEEYCVVIAILDVRGEIRNPVGMRSAQPQSIGFWLIHLLSHFAFFK